MAAWQLLDTKRDLLHAWVATWIGIMLAWEELTPYDFSFQRAT